jgi:hypothetical protein
LPPISNIVGQDLAQTITLSAFHKSLANFNPKGKPPLAQSKTLHTLKEIKEEKEASTGMKKGKTIARSLSLKRTNFGLEVNNDYNSL